MFCSNPKPGMFGSVRCRKCPDCLRLRQSDWVRRSVWEVLASDKAVFITLTFRFKPKDGKNGYSEFQRYFKRVRKAQGGDAQLRYLCASELGERRGRYHLHALIAVDGAKPAVHFFRNRWKAGITHARAIASDNPARVARYVTSYLAKSGRVRCSIGFGTSSKTAERVIRNVRQSSPTAAAVFDAFPASFISQIRFPGQKTGVKPPREYRKASLRVAQLRPRISPRQFRTSHSDLSISVKAEN